MVALEIQRGKDGMRTQQYSAEFGGTTACCLRLAEACSFPDDADTAKEGFKGDAWFGSVKAAAEAGQRGRRAVLQVKTNKALFPKEFIGEALNNMPGGVWIVLKGTHPNGVKLVALGYRYSTKTTLFFIFTEDAGSTKKGTPYEMKWTNDRGNVCVREVDRPDVVSHFFEQSNLIDVHNQLRQDELALEKRWVTNDGYFRLATTLVGINTVDCWRLASFHNILDKDQVGITRFAGILGRHMLRFANAIGTGSVEGAESARLPPSLITMSEHSSNTSSISGNADFVATRYFTDVNMNEHWQVKFPTTQSRGGKKYTKARPCKLCQKGALFHCFQCSLSFCCPNPFNGGRDCFRAHVQAITRSSDRTGDD